MRTKFRRAKPYVLTLFILYVLAVLYAVLAARRRSGVSADTFRSHLNLVPFTGKSLFLDGSRHPLVENYIFYTDLVGNVFLLMPLPMFLLWLFPRMNKTIVIVLSFAVSIAVEVGQYALGVGISDVDDVILNTAGAGIGVIIYQSIKYTFDARLK